MSLMSDFECRLAGGKYLFDALVLIPLVIFWVYWSMEAFMTLLVGGFLFFIARVGFGLGSRGIVCGFLQSVSANVRSQ